MRLSRRRILLAVVVSVSAVSLPAAFGSEPVPSIEAVNSGIYGHYWSPSSAKIAEGGEVDISNSTSVHHGVEWVGGPATPTCTSGVPVGNTPAASGANWSGSCTFTKAGTYTFYCTVHGPEMTGTITVSTPGAPTVSTGSAVGVNETEATLKGTVNPQGKTTTYFFNYGTSNKYGSQTPEESVPTGTVGEPVSALIKSLSPGTTYHFQVVAKDEAGTTFGEDETFTTNSPPGPPVPTTGTASGVNETDATLKGTVNPDGLTTKYFFEWGTTEHYGQSTPETAAGEDHTSHAATFALSLLAPGTVYHFRLVAKNSSGTVNGLDNTFTTTSPPAKEPEKKEPTPEKKEPAPEQKPTPQLNAPPTPVAITSGQPTGPLLVGSPSIASGQRGSSLHGSLQVAAAGVGARLEVDLLVKGSSLSKSRKGTVQVGRFVRASVAAGKVSFSIALNGAAKHALAHQHHLSVSVKITLTPAAGHALTVTRTVVLHS